MQQSTPQEPRLLDCLRTALRTRHYSPRTEEAYVAWIVRFVRFAGARHVDELGFPEVSRFLSSLAVERDVSASTQNQAACAIAFLFRHVIERDFPWLEDVIRAKRPRRLPVVLTREEVARVLAAIDGTPRFMVALLYGSGLRLLECCRLRTKDLDLDTERITVRAGKGDRDRTTILPSRLVAPLRAHLERVRRQHRADIAAGAGFVELPNALARKLPNAAREWPWQWVFPATRTYTESESRERRRHHLHESVVQRAVRTASLAAGLTKRVTCHTFRHTFATHLLEAGYDIRTIQQLLGHRDLRTTMIYTHVLGKGWCGVRSPVDALTSAFGSAD